MSILNTALSGANANRAALNVTALNIANAHTVGYSRQQAMQATTGATGASIGGVEVTSIRRIADDFISAQIWSSKSELGNASYSMENFAKLEEIMGIEGYNISSGMDDFFGAISESTTGAESTALRQKVLSQADSLAQRFSGLSNAIQDQHQKLSDDRNSSIININELLGSIATNTESIIAIGGSSAILEDQRDLLVGQLSELVDLEINKGSGGELQLSLPNGQPLLINSKIGELQATPLASDPLQATLNVIFNGNKFPVSTNAGGQLGAIETSQKNDLIPLIDALDDMTVFLADGINTALSGGTDMKGNSPAVDLFFYDPSNPAATLVVNDLSPDQLAFSKTGAPGDGGILEELLAITGTKFSVTGQGFISLDEAFSSITGDVAFSSRKSQSTFDSSTSLYNQVQSSREQLSGVSSEEESANLMMYANSYEANMKVISTANQMFNTILNAF
ncbi:flagellar hook-associated protein FlgK [Psychromonas sp. Urea-02u-13]|uniref:flagellar hook-associated protein FlgK n=1 Tax=Psychromonas sp. Urea-02u-13 TaxID=2058326 RepID=UPI000C342EBA|nr:flagellar hook-associated protein FlgK [Psychromonas sp. Urea-02u-13]PKG39536.1 flagellar hook-associated protein FlgK [Psychromonas sp. Urea-02u-13]